MYTIVRARYLGLPSYTNSALASWSIDLLCYIELEPALLCSCLSYYLFR